MNNLPGKTPVKKRPRTENAGPTLHSTLGPVADLEAHLPPDWWRTLFNALYIKTDGDVVENPDNTAKDLALIRSASGLQPQDRILDLCCGQGRHTLALAQAGYTHVQGIDRSRYLIRLAKRRAHALQLPVQFREGDARQIKLAGASQDGVIVMGNSFGYFSNAEDDLAVLRAIRRVLRPGGTLLLDIVDGAWMRQHFEPRSWEWIDRQRLVCRERSLTADRARIVSREVVVDGRSGVLADQFYAERLYTFDEIGERLQRLGFDKVHCHGNVVADSSRGQDLGMMGNRMIVTAVAA